MPEQTVYEILRMESCCGADLPTPFTPPLRVARLEVVELLVPILERQFQTEMEVRYGGVPLQRKAMVANA